MEICGIYCIENLINHKKYVGLSKNCYKRWKDHLTHYENSLCKGDDKKPLYLAMKKYGKENFEFSILEECEKEKLKEREIYWISKLNTYNCGYNATHGGDLPEGHVLKGEEHGMHILTEVEVIECRKAYADGIKCKDYYDSHNFKEKIKFSGFQNMWFGRTWKEVMPEVFENNPHPKRKITDEEIRTIKNLFKQGYKCSEVYHLLNEKYSRTTINDIFHERRYKDIN